MDYETVIREKFPNCDVEVIAPDFFELNKLIEYITDDIIIIKPQSIIVYRHMIRFLKDASNKSKIYYLNGFSDEEIQTIHAELLKFTWKNDIKINLFKNSDPDKEVLGI